LTWGWVVELNPLNFQLPRAYKNLFGATALVGSWIYLGH